MNPIWLFALVAAWYVGKSSSSSGGTTTPAAENPQPAALPAPTVLQVPAGWVPAGWVPASTVAKVPTTLDIPPGWAAPVSADTPAVPNMPEPGSDAEKAIFGVLPDAVRDSVVTAYRGGTNPDKLDELATTLETTYPTVASALHARAAFLRAKISTGS